MPYVDIERAKLDPASAFKRPSDILKDASLSRELKIDLLQRWAYDEREKAVAEEENMTAVDNDRNNYLQEIVKCLLELGITDQERPPPTKQG